MRCCACDCVRDASRFNHLVTAQQQAARGSPVSIMRIPNLHGAENSRPCCLFRYREKAIDVDVVLQARCGMACKSARGDVARHLLQHVTLITLLLATQGNDGHSLSPNPGPEHTQGPSRWMDYAHRAIAEQLPQGVCTCHNS
jgi:hypothetical protein